MADVLSKSQLFVASCGGHLPSSSSSCGSPAKRGTFIVQFPAVSSSSIRFRSLKSSSSGNLFGRKVFVERDDTFSRTTAKDGIRHVPAQMSLTLAKTRKWWEKGVQPNMKEVSSAQDLVDSLQNAGDKLVIVDFFSPGCGGCRALHPKICQFAEANPDVMFLQVNYEEHKSMCYSLTVHVLPFFRFYRGSQGRLCSFSCTNATIKKFKDALAKHNTDRCGLGPTKGLEESELLALAANKDLNFTYTGKPEHGIVEPDELAVEPIPVTFPPPPSKPAKEEKSFVTAWK